MKNRDRIESYLIERIMKLAYPQKPIATSQSPRLLDFSNIKAVIFDVYGTLLIARSGDIGLSDDDRSDQQAFADSLQYLELTDNRREAAKKGVELFQEVLETEHNRKKSQGIPYPEVDIVQIWHEVFSLLEENRLVKEGISEDHHLLMKFAVEFEIRFNPPWPMPHMMKTLEQLREWQLTLGIVSNSQFYTPLTFEAFTGNTMEDLGFEQSLLKWSYDKGIAKPSLGLYELLIEDLYQQFGITTPETLYIGNDMLNDIYPAHELNLNTALFAGDKRSLKWREHERRVQDVTPDLIVTDLSQIIDCCSAQA